MSQVDPREVFPSSTLYEDWRGIRLNYKVNNVRYRLKYLFNIGSLNSSSVSLDVEVELVHRRCVGY